MNGWIIGLVAGGVLLLVLVVLLGVVVKAAATTAKTAQAVLAAMEEVRANTAALAELGELDLEALGAVGNGAPADNRGTGPEEQRREQG
jgi:type II secretory pathway component PulM